MIGYVWVVLNVPRNADIFLFSMLSPSGRGCGGGSGGGGGGGGGMQVRDGCMLHVTCCLCTRDGTLSTNYRICMFA